MFDENRAKRRIVKFEDIPPVLVNAVVSIEDKRFFQHSGFDPDPHGESGFCRRTRPAAGAGRVDFDAATGEECFGLIPRKTFGRKFDELLITVHLEHKLTKQKIFEYYANQVPLGRRGSFGIRGFGEAAQAFFGKDMQPVDAAGSGDLGRTDSGAECAQSLPLARSSHSSPQSRSEADAR